MQKNVSVQKIDLEEISTSDLIKRETELKRVKKIVDGALEICKKNDGNCEGCPGTRIKRVRENYYLRGDTCTVGYFAGEEAARCVIGNGYKNPELIKAITSVNINSLNYRDNVRPTLENLREQLELL